MNMIATVLKYVERKPRMRSCKCHAQLFLFFSPAAEVAELKSSFVVVSQCDNLSGRIQENSLILKAF